MADDVDKDARAQALIAFIKTDVLRGPGDIDANRSLFDSGLLDSMSVFAVLMKVEDLTNRRIPAARLRIKDVDTVTLLLAAAERVGKPR